MTSYKINFVALIVGTIVHRLHIDKNKLVFKSKMEAGLNGVATQRAKG